MTLVVCHDEPMTPRQYAASVARIRSPKGRKRTRAKRRRREMVRVMERHGISWGWKVAYPQERIEEMVFAGSSWLGLLPKKGFE